MGKRIGIICFALILGFVLLPRLRLARSAPRLESRTSQLKAQNMHMRSRLNRLESRLSQLRGQAPEQPSPRQPAPSVPSCPKQQVCSSDPMFDCLATLAIELKERIQALEKQVAELRKQHNS